MRRFYFSTVLYQPITVTIIAFYSEMTRKSGE